MTGSNEKLYELEKELKEMCVCIRKERRMKHTEDKKKLEETQSNIGAYQIVLGT